jgi:serine/threonine protein kinase
MSIMLSVTVLLSAIVGFLFAMRCSKDLSLSDYSLTAQYDDDLNEPNSLSLNVLASSGHAGIDIHQCYLRAMQARHLNADEQFDLLNPKEISVNKVIGEGSFGRVWSGTWRNNSVAVKEFVFAQTAIVGGSRHWESIVEEIIGEAGIMKYLNHPKILQLYGCSITMQAVWIVCELCERGSLRMILNNNSIILPIEMQASLCLDIAEGMMYLHRRTPPIIHRDLKSHNIFITEPTPGKLVAKIGDWGSARAIAKSSAGRSMTQGVGTACWLAPEVLNNNCYSKQSDVYAFGIVLWEVNTREEVHKLLSAAQIIVQVSHNGLRPVIPPGCIFADLMRKCWSQDPNDRPGFATLVAALSEIYSKSKLPLKRAKSVEKGNVASPNQNFMSMPIKKNSSNDSSKKRKDDMERKE